MRKMPIFMSGQTIWVDCADSDAQSNTANNSLMLDLDTGATTTVSTSPHDQQQQQQPQVQGLPKPVQTTINRRSVKELTEEEKNKIIEDCCVKLISPQVRYFGQLLCNKPESRILTETASRNYFCNYTFSILKSLILLKLLSLRLQLFLMIYFLKLLAYRNTVF